LKAGAPDLLQRGFRISDRELDLNLFVAHRSRSSS
jgi:hypothetical protein